MSEDSQIILLYTGELVADFPVVYVMEQSVTSTTHTSLPNLFLSMCVMHNERSRKNSAPELATLALLIISGHSLLGRKIDRPPGNQLESEKK